MAKSAYDERKNRINRRITSMAEILLDVHRLSTFNEVKALFVAVVRHFQRHPGTCVVVERCTSNVGWGKRWWA